MSDAPRFYVTTPIYYVNDEPHIGHTYTTVVADVVARYRRATGHDVFFLTGTDEHGQKIERAARSLGLKPMELADRVVHRYLELWRELHIQYDDFIRTTEPRHRKAVEKLIGRMEAAGDIYLDEYEGMYCAGCEAFYPDSQVEDGRCPDQGHPVERVREASYFFRLSKYQQPLLEHYERHPGFVRPESRFNEVKAFVAGGLRDLSISRTGVQWGIPFPGAPGHVVYVWVDALTNYISALGFGEEPPGERMRYWPARLHLVGKDILRFHAVYWPAFLMSAGIELPECVYAHGWWLRDDSKMSKSLGNVVKPGPLIRDFGADALRYFLMREMTFGQDGSYSDEQLLDRYNGDLANDLGNLVSRLTAMIHSGFGGALPPPSPEPEAAALEPSARRAFEAYHRAFDAYAFREGLEAVWGLINDTNRFLVDQAPWELAKQPDARSRLAAVLRGAAEALLQAVAMLRPVMPAKADIMARRLGTSLPERLDTFRWGLLPDSGTVTRGAPVFPRVDKHRYFAEETSMENTSRPDSTEPGAESVPQITLDEFLRVDLRTAKIISAERIPGADKLLKLQVDLGGERRQLVAGIAKAYEPEALVGRQIIVVANLKPARLRGVESQGMLLAADAGDGPVLATFDRDVPPGTRVR